MPNQPVQPAPGAGETPDRRAHRRASLLAPVMVETNELSRPARALNVSGGGIWLETELELLLGQDVSVYFELPIGYAVETLARVVRVEADRVALRFLELPREAELALRSYCKISGLHQAVKP